MKEHVCVCKREREREREMLQSIASHQHVLAVWIVETAMCQCPASLELATHVEWPSMGANETFANVTERK
jgi:hypothetical protein